MADQTPQTTTLSAVYTSPTNAQFTHAQPLPLPSTNSPPDRAAYLASLRERTAEMQEKINKELTERMEEDKAKEETAGGTGKRKANELDEKKEEENYGEEVVEED